MVLGPSGGLNRNSSPGKIPRTIDISKPGAHADMLVSPRLKLGALEGEEVR
jgi:hypothetical protein